MKVCIVIPVYKENPSHSDLFSINSIISCSKSCDWIDIYYAHPLDLDLSKYPEVYGAEEFRNEYFTSTTQYSELLRTADFYNRFNNYTYMLIYQTDCYVLYPNDFENEFREWCNKDFDYIGAPIITNANHWGDVPCVGNGGCSLRKISKFISICENAELYNKLMNSQLKDLYIQYEDLYFCRGVSNEIYMDMAHFSEAAKFAWDMNPDLLYRGGHIWPLFVHAWDKNLPFWREHFNAFSYRDDILREKHESYHEFWEKYYHI